jgi:hypothetical protein
MSVRTLLLATSVLMIAGPAVSAEYFILYDPDANRCAISESPPAGDKIVLVGDGGYGDRATAEADMKVSYPCIAQGGTTTPPAR